MCTTKKFVDTKVNAAAHQQVIFSHIRYADPVYLEPFEEEKLHSNQQLLLVTGLANAQSLTDMLDSRKMSYTHLAYADHQHYGKKQLEQIEKQFAALAGDKKLVLTTEKDFVKLREHAQWFIDKQIPLAYLPIEIGFDEHDRAIFIRMIEDYVKQYQRNR